jgi:pimeloyl-ACP methyl ester carboxylesterase
VSYRDEGEGPAVMLVHGIGGSPRWWRPVVPELARAHRVVVPHLGYGGGAPRLALAAVPGVLLGTADLLGLGRLALVGHSLGALACLELARAAPERVDRLVLIAPPVRPAAARMTGNALPLARTLLGMPPAAAAVVMSDLASRSPAALLRAAADVLAHRLDEAAAPPRAPTLVVWGARDALVPIGGAGWVARHLPRARSAVIAGAGHVPMLDRPRELTRELLAFLDPG